jgi:hypothetical protein
MKIRCLLLSLGLLAACGGNDPTPDPDKAASAPAIEASVNEAREVAEQAQEKAEEKAEEKARP